MQLQEELERIQQELDSKNKEAEKLRRDLEKQKQRASSIQYQLNCVHNSVSFRVGWGITSLPRKLRDTIAGILLKKSQKTPD